MERSEPQLALFERFEHWEFVLEEGTFEECLVSLEEVVSLLDEGNLPLNDSLRCYELGVLISRRCEKMIDEAELRISRLAIDGIDSPIDDPEDDLSR
jgi:exodeoxyribonuclease VII small subunit